MRRHLSILLTVLFVTPSHAQDRSQGRSMVITQYGIVASENPLASQVGTAILAQGGNAIDAAVATNAVMGLMAPTGNGIGGDLFAIVYHAESKEVYGLNASGWSPKTLTADMLKRQGFSEMPERGVHAITVPGVVDGWAKLLDRFGKMKFKQVLAPAIRYAEEGFPVTELVAQLWPASERMLRNDANASQVFLPNGRPPQTGEIFKNPLLAWSLKQIAEKGREVFYRGEIAGHIVSYVKQHGGVMSLEDLSEFSSEWVETISTTYRGWKVHEIPPNGQGIAALVMLNIMEHFPIGSYGHNSTDALHVMIEAKKLAYADMLRYVADQRFSKIPVEGMLSKEYAGERAALIDKNRANCAVDAGTPPNPGDDTIFLSVVDKVGNMVALIQSNYSGFGSGLVPNGVGFMLHNRGALFSLDPSSPNVLEGRKRPLHTIIPALMEKGDTRIAFGIMGGWNQSLAHAQFVSNVVDHGMNVQQAMEAARFTKTTFKGCDVQIEQRVPDSIRAALISRGHELEVRGDFSGRMGGGQAVMRDYSTKINYGASDPRKDGAAVPEPIPLR
ncbi:MAG: gamma-glutamyltransferase [Ignavibacteria bacterium]|nr:gamma-glutamyltransferase [Ignavibacteria bacterium]